jgi:hypothetical protein
MQNGGFIESTCIRDAIRGADHRTITNPNRQMFRLDRFGSVDAACVMTPVEKYALDWSHGGPGIRTAASRTLSDLAMERTPIADAPARQEPQPQSIVGNGS